MADYDIKKFQYIQGPDNEYHEFPIGMSDAEVDAEMAVRYKDYKPDAAVPDVPLQPVPQDDWRQQEATSALEAVQEDKPWIDALNRPPAPTEIQPPPPAGTRGERRASLLPISSEY